MGKPSPVRSGTLRLGGKKDKSQAQRTTNEVQEGFEMREVIFSQRADYEGFMMLLAQI